MDYLIARLKEPSTWRGAVMLAIGLGVGISPGQIETIVSLGTAVVGAIGMFAPDTKRGRVMGQGAAAQQRRR